MLLLQGDALMSQMIRVDQISLDNVSSHWCCRPGMNLVSEMGNLIKVVSLFDMRGEPVSQQDASRYV